MNEGRFKLPKHSSAIDVQQDQSDRPMVSSESQVVILQEQIG